MAWLLGVDEAGYGPNLGPLVVTATLWATDENPARCNPWKRLASTVTSAPEQDDDRFHIADSKQVYNPSIGTAALERGVLAALHALGFPTSSFGTLCGRLMSSRLSFDDDVPSDTVEPWFTNLEESLPLDGAAEDVGINARRWQTAFETSGLRLAGVASEIVYAPRFNRLIDAWGNKSAVLSRITLRLVRSLWNPDDATPCVVLCDKHGGRNRYQELLLEVSNGAMVLTLAESREVSRYRVGSTEFRFQVGCEEHLPTALASMVSKYIREVAMRRFNRWWSERLPDIRPTAGYPGDARRFREDIAAHLATLGLAEDDFWRKR
ncbi:MAG: hypothetical protein IT428_00255 [Planctomycetaceae bacterium]|nr:hypothetical protein [Planctomycetaceae bacterium]